MKAFSFFNAATGEILPQHLLCPSATDVAQHVPPGMVAIEGRHDWRTHRVNVDTLEVELRDPPPSSLRDAAIAARFERGVRLVASDLVIVRAHERGEVVPAAWVAYRQALRDIPEQPGFPLDIDWPVPPTP